MKNKRNLNRKWLLLQNDQNADTTLLHSHDEMRLTIAYSKIKKLNLVLINNAIHHRETLSEWPIRLPLSRETFYCV